MKAILKYPGSKWGLAKWIISYPQVGSKKKEVLWMNFEPDGQMEMELEIET